MYIVSFKEQRQKNSLMYIAIIQLITNIAFFTYQNIFIY
jgi:hypothetical protein